MCVRLRAKRIGPLGTCLIAAEGGRGVTLPHRLHCALFSHAWKNGCIGDGWSTFGSKLSGTFGGSFHRERAKRAPDPKLTTKGRRRE